MTTENHDQPPGKQNPASSLPQQEKRWTVRHRHHGTALLDTNADDPSSRCWRIYEEAADEIAEAHNATLSEPKESEEEKKSL